MSETGRSIVKSTIISKTQEISVTVTVVLSIAKATL